MKLNKSFSLFLLSVLTTCSTQKDEPLQPLDDVMMQAFYWDVPVDAQAKDGTWWDHLSSLAPELKAAGISSLWTPIPAKGNWGIYDSGYGIYDHYDLGNYDQKGSIETRYGSRAELERMIATMHASGINVYSDVVLNHLYGGDENFEANPTVTAYVRRGVASRTPRATSNGRTIRLIRERIFSFPSTQARANQTMNGTTSTSIRHRPRIR